jgi:hypothetical protein
MNTNVKLLPTEVAALIHHVELHRTGWWDKAIQRLILAAFWLAGQPQTIDEIIAILKSEFHLTLNAQKVGSAIDILASQDVIILLPGNFYRIPDKQRLLFGMEIAEAEKSEVLARSFFASLVNELCAEFDSDTVWKTFEAEFLAPLIKEVGANAYRLIAGEKMTADKKLERRFQEHFDAKYHTALNELVTRFLDPKKDEVRNYVSRMLHATFCIEASGLPDNIIKKFSTSAGKQISFRIFVDTNFLFSILALHENPSNSAARELQELIGTLKGNPKISLFVTPRTIDEAKHSISLAKGQLLGVPDGMNFTSAALRVGFSGMAEKFLEERGRRAGKLSPGDWFDPYLNNFVSIARGKGVELFNEKLDGYATRQDVVDDIHLVMKAEERRNGRRKTYEMVQHDMILWHLVDDNRPAYIESPIDANDWILTVDFRLIGFDEHKQKQLNSKVPICLHPTSLIQLLQFWVPRTKEFEEAVLGSLRLPFLFQDFDAEAERTSLRILKGIGRFENSEHLPEEAITDVVLNEALRARIKTEQDEAAETTLIRDALLEEMKFQADAESDRAKQLDAEGKNKDRTIEQLKEKVSAEETKFLQAEASLQTQGQEIDDLKKTVKRQEDRHQQQRTLFRYAVLLFGMFVIAFGIAWWLAERMLQLASLIGIDATRAIIGIVAFILLHLCLELSASRNEQMKRLWPFRQISRFRSWLWSLVILGFVLGVVGNLVANRIQQKIDNQNPAPHTSTDAQQLK